MIAQVNIQEFNLVLSWLKIYKIFTRTINIIQVIKYDT